MKARSSKTKEEVEAHRKRNEEADQRQCDAEAAQQQRELDNFINLLNNSHFYKSLVTLIKPKTSSAPFGSSRRQGKIITPQKKE